MSELLKPGEVAERLKVGANTVLKWVKKGYVKHLRVGRIIRVEWPLAKPEGAVQEKTDE